MLTGHVGVAVSAKTEWPPSSTLRLGAMAVPGVDVPIWGEGTCMPGDRTCLTCGEGHTCPGGWVDIEEWPGGI